MQYFFINGRYVKTDTAAVAMSRAYQGLIMTGRFPACVLHIEVAPEAVDVNVHPAKIEVRFVNEKPVFEAVYHGVRSALQSGDTLQKVTLPNVTKRESPFLKRDVPQVNGGMQSSFNNLMRPTTPTAPKPAPLQTTPRQVPITSVECTVPPIVGGVPETKPTRVRDDSVEPIITVPKLTKPVTTAPVQEEPPVITEVQPEAAEEMQVAETAEMLPPRVIGEIFTTYILAEHGDEMLVIDKHAAHERILYNSLKDSATPDAQMLLSPVTVTLDSDACNALLSALPLLTKAGYVIEDFGGLTVLVRAVPTVLSGCDVTAVIEEIAGGLASGKRDILTAKEDWIYHSIACRAAIKAGDATTPAEWQLLVEKVLSDPEVRYCPHGRPVCFVMTKKELEKQFGRIV